MKPLRSILTVVILSIGAAATPHGRVGITVRPTSHDFGKEIVGKTGGNPEEMFAIQLPPGATNADRVGIIVRDPTQEDFKVDEGPSWRPEAPLPGVSTASFVCGVSSISNAPTTTLGGPVGTATSGVVSAVLTGSEARIHHPDRSEERDFDGDHAHRDGGRGMRLHGHPGCNYAPLYYGSFNWSHTITSANSSYAEDVNVDVLWGVATCNVTAKQVENGQSRTGTVVAGKGLIAVEFLNQAGNSSPAAPNWSIASSWHAPHRHGPKPRTRTPHLLDQRI
jgi:hypothetical protein